MAGVKFAPKWPESSLLTNYVKIIKHFFDTNLLGLD